MAFPILALGTSTSSPVEGNANGTKYVMADLADETGVVISSHCIGYAGTLTTTANIYQKGCTMTETDRGSFWVNIGTLAVPSWKSLA